MPKESMEKEEEKTEDDWVRGKVADDEDDEGGKDDDDDGFGDFDDW